MEHERKSYKRETASLLMLFLCGLFVWGAGWGNEAATEAGRYLSLPIFTVFFAAFGVEGARQLNIGGKA